MLAVEALDPKLLLHVTGTASAGAVRGVLSVLGLGTSRLRELLGISDREDLALAHRRHEVGEPARLEHRRAAADLARCPLGQPDPTGDAPEPDVVAVAGPVLVGTGRGVWA